MSIVVFFSAFTPDNVSGQDMLEAMIKGIGESAIERSEQVIQQGPDQLQEFLAKSKSGEPFGSAAECLGALQVAVGAAAISANLLPFSQVATKEDHRGPVGQFRILFNGTKVNVEMYCRQNVLTAIELPWEDVASKGEQVHRSTLDVVAGLLLLLKLQGAFDRENANYEISGETLPEDPKHAFDQVNERLSEATSQAKNEATITSLPMTATETKLLKAQVQDCWVVDVGSQAAETTVTVAFQLTKEGRVDGSIKLVASEGGTSQSVKEAFQSARRAILRCQRSGYDLPEEKFEHWKFVELTFSPDVRSLD